MARLTASTDATRRLRLPVTVLRWPDQDAERRRLAAERRPRVLVTASGVTPDSILDELELWVRDDAGAGALLQAVEQLGTCELVAVPDPVLDPDGLLHYDGRWVGIPPALLTVVTRLVDAYRNPVPLAELDAAYHPTTGTAGHRSLPSRLNARLRTVGLEVQSAYRQGLVLTPAMPNDIG